MGLLKSFENLLRKLRRCSIMPFSQKNTRYEFLSLLLSACVAHAAYSASIPPGLFLTPNFHSKTSQSPMPTTLLHKTFADLLLKLTIHPNDPAAHLMPSNLIHGQPCSQILRQQALPTRLAQQLQNLLINLIPTGYPLNHRLLKMKQTLQASQDRPLRQLNLLHIPPHLLDQLQSVLHTADSSFLRPLFTLLRLGLNGYRSGLHAAMHTPVLQQCSDTRRTSVHKLG